jgi:hypothetical protein
MQNGSNPILHYRWEEGSSTPQLRVSDGHLGDKELKPIQAYLRTNYQDLCRRDGEVLAVGERKFRLSVLGDSRYRELQLEQLSATSTVPPPREIKPEDIGWARAWLGELEKMLAGSPDPLAPGAAGRYALGFVFQELHARSRTDTGVLALQLLAAFLLVEAPACKERDHARSQQYELALEEMERVCIAMNDSTIPLPFGGKLDARATISPAPAWYLWLGQMFRGLRPEK